MLSSLQELKTALDGLQIPVAYRHFSKPTSTPYCVYYVEGTDNLSADNITYYETKDVSIELYTDKKDLTLEESLKTILTNNDIPYEQTFETYIAEEKLFEVVYSINL